MFSSPARLEAPEPESWIPIDLLETLPEFEDFLNEENLVDSGQTRAVRMDQEGRALILKKSPQTSQPDSEAKMGEYINEIARKSHKIRRLESKQRSARLQRKTRIQRRLFAGILSLSVIGAAVIGLAQVGNSDSTDDIATRPVGHSAISPVKIDYVVEGQHKSALSTASSLEGFINEQSLDGYVGLDNRFDRDEITTRRSIPALEFRKEKNVNIAFDGTSIVSKSTALTVKDVLAENKVAYDGDDLVTPGLETPLDGISNISINRVTSSSRVQEQTVPFQTINKNDSNLMSGQTKVVQQGQNGTESVTYTQTLRDGQVVSEVVASTQVLRAPQPKIIAVGTKKAQVAKKSSPSNASSGKASYYSHKEGTCAHRTLPMGTVVTVTNTANGKSTTCKVADRGPFVDGRIIDLDKGVFSQIASVSSGVINVTISY